MKCKVSLLVITSFLFSSVVCSSGSESVKSYIAEKPDAKLVIDGRQTYFKHPAIDVMGKLLVPATDFLAYFDSKNKKPVISWNPRKKTFSVSFNSKKLTYKIESSKVLVNDSIINADCSPILYKGKVYIPLEFTAAVLGDNVVREEYTDTVLIRKTKEFNKVRTVLKKIRTAQESYKRAKFNVYNGIYTINGEIDREKKKMHFFSPFYGTNDKLEMYIIDNTVFFKNGVKGGSLFGDNKNWSYFKIGRGMLGDSFNIPMNYEDAVCAGLILTEDKKKGKFILEGDIYIDEFYKRPTVYYNMTKYNDVRKVHTRLIFDGHTYLMEYGCMDVTYLNYFTYKIKKERVVYEFKDYNSSKINVSLDSKSRRNAKNFGSTLVGSGFEIFEDYVVK